MTTQTHTHICPRCRERRTCSGELVENVDGWPTTICEAFHLPSGAVRECSVCLRTRWCDWCGERPGTVTVDDHRICQPCLSEAWHQHRTDRRERPLER